MKLIPILTAIAVVTSFSASARPSDVVPKKIKVGSSYVRVTKLTKSKVRFEHCQYGLEDKTCTPIGSKDAYTTQEIEAQRLYEIADIAIALAADAAIIFTAFSTAGFLVSAAASHGVLGSMTGVGAMTLGTTASGLVSGIAITAIDKINPVEQAKQVAVICPKVINDVNYPVENIENFIDRLDNILSEID